MIHKPVLLEEVINNLNLKPGMTVIDGTLGTGGHSIAILKKIIPGGKLISIDWDRRAIENFAKILKKEGFDISNRNSPAPITSNAYGENISPSAFVPLFSGDKIVGYWRGVNDNYANLDKVIRGLPDVTSGADAVFADLGFSSDQIEDEERGFSFLKDGPLDMRYSPQMQKVTAVDIVNKYSEKDLADIFWKYGEERYSKRIAKGIVEARKAGQIARTGELVKIISESVPEPYKRKRIHFATRIFQALRIEVNQELSNLKIFLEKAANILTNKGRLAVISFHSLEDRIVKQFFQKEFHDCVCPPKFPKCVCEHKARLKIITKKPIGPSEDEVRDNPRARSAKLRVAEKL
ncbi:MAG: 16S rRNA (cytosine(1402)-N(4))-methyltransferase RsmH [Patescibacteria group bacterium]|nr:16S rRNA (cytosine(1402)-N(4))-methyltransferase RsmH [Patescibacteria group bacterium]